ncbi:GNAT family N-acetyltransferase [Thalassococcus lentus]|uniref:N-acetyltransferase n=1 Tax=Thalassococcus lentus TaxID=1210524 RepID=A0ABT4XVE0_9RHOB|nr:N-acetyltransferase [Thalassococcus lentus]MDA7425862.1 N-acetyltransferase [Thalassococcus lentus]
MFTLSQETAEDWWDVEALFDLSFAPGRSALSSYRLREDVDPVSELCRVARDDQGILGGAIRYWPVQISGQPTLLLGPVAVHPTAQGEGLGGALIRDTLARARDLGHHRVILVGDAPYYSRFGFEKLQDVKMPPPTNPERILGCALQPGAWQNLHGTVKPVG